MLPKGLNKIVHGRADSPGCGFLITELAEVIHIPAWQSAIKLQIYIKRWFT